MTRAVVVARAAYAYVVRYHTLEDLLMVEGNIAKLNERGNVMCLEENASCKNSKMWKYILKDY